MSKSIKIIDLLNKISNWEEVPIKINYHGSLYVWSKERQYYELENKNYIFLTFETNELNDEVEEIDIEEQEIDIEELEDEICKTRSYSEAINKLVKAVMQLDKKIKEK